MSLIRSASPFVSLLIAGANLLTRDEARRIAVNIAKLANVSAVERAGPSSLNEGRALEFEPVSNRGKTSAENLRVRR
jgi:hypothetical protein